MREFAWVLGAAAMLLSAAPPAQAERLTLDQVLASSSAHFPSVLAAIAARRGADGGVLVAEGAFDTVFSTDATSRAAGFWDGSVLNTQVRRNLRTLGASVYGGYKLSDGNFPIYEDVNFTNTGGEARVGVVFSILRDRAFDSRRFQESVAQLDVSGADLELLLVRIGVQHQAQLAYWRWTATAVQLAVYEELLQLAEARQRALEEQVAAGARARIFLTENTQNILRRRILVTAAQREFQVAANTLSLYFRDTGGEPFTPARDNAPPSLGAISEIAAPTPDGESLDLQSRPELGLLQVALQRASEQSRLARNDLLPRFDVSTEISRDFGAIAEGGVSRDSTDAVIGFRFSVPLERRAARGALARAEAERTALAHRLRLAQERIEIEVRTILVELETARQLVGIAEQEIDQAETLANAERDRFSSGISDFFLVNIREEAAADARIRAVQAQLGARVARANYDAATVQLARLGLVEG